MLPWMVLCMCSQERIKKKKKRKGISVILGAAVRRATSGGYSETRASFLLPRKFSIVEQH